MDNPGETQSGWQAFAIGSAAFAAATAILGKLGVAEVNSNLATLIRTVVVVIFTASIVSARGEWEPFSRISRYGAVMLMLSGVATAASWLCYYRALQMAPASRVAPVDKLSVVLVAILAITLLGEPLTWKMAIAVTLITVGAAMLAS